MLRCLALIFALIFALSTPLALADTPPPGEPGAQAAKPSPPETTPAPTAEPAPAIEPAAPVPEADLPPFPTPVAPAVPAAPAGPTPAEEQKQFDLYRRPLTTLLALRAEADLLVAAAELAYPDTQDKKRPPALKTPALLKRAQKFGPDSGLVRS